MTAKSIRGALAGLLCTALVAAVSIHNETYFGAEWLLRDWISARLALRRSSRAVRHVKPRLKNDTGVILAERWDEWTQPSTR